MNHQIACMVGMTVKAVDGEADIAREMRFERVPVIGDLIDLHTNESDPDGECDLYHKVTQVILSTRNMPDITLATWEVNRDAGWGMMNDFDDSAVPLSLSELLTDWFTGWKVEERRTVWNTLRNEWSEPECAAFCDKLEPVAHH